MGAVLLGTDTAVLAVGHIESHSELGRITEVGKEDNEEKNQDVRNCKLFLNELRREGGLGLLSLFLGALFALAYERTHEGAQKDTDEEHQREEQNGISIDQFLRITHQHGCAGHQEDHRIRRVSELRQAASQNVPGADADGSGVVGALTGNLAFVATEHVTGNGDAPVEDAARDAVDQRRHRIPAGIAAQHIHQVLLISVFRDHPPVQHLFQQVHRHDDCSHENRTDGKSSIIGYLRLLNVFPVFQFCFIYFLIF